MASDYDLKDGRASIGEGRSFSSGFYSLWLQPIPYLINLSFIWDTFVVYCMDLVKWFTILFKENLRILFWIIIILHLTADTFYIPWITPQHLEDGKLSRSITFNQKLIFIIQLAWCLGKGRRSDYPQGLLGQLYEVSCLQQHWQW